MLTNGQKQQRKRGVGASETPALAGEHPHMTAFDVFADKVGLPRVRPVTEAMNMGHLIEDVIIRDHEQRTGRTIVRGDALGTSAHRQLPLILASPDGMYTDGDGLVEVKNVSHFEAKNWGEPETAGVPPHVWIQVQQQMSVKRSEGAPVAFTDVLVLFGGCQRARYRVPFQVGVEDLLAPIIEDFWALHVLPKIPPIDGLPTLEQLRAIHPEDDGSIIQSTPDLDHMAARLKIIRNVLERLGEREKEAEAYLKAAMGPAALLNTTVGPFSWKKQADSQTWDAPALAELARALGATPEQLQDCMKVRKGSRPFLVPSHWKKERQLAASASNQQLLTEKAP